MKKIMIILVMIFMVSLVFVNAYASFEIINDDANAKQAWLVKSGDVSKVNDSNPVIIFKGDSYDELVEYLENSNIETLIIFNEDVKLGTDIKGLTGIPVFVKFSESARNDTETRVCIDTDNGKDYYTKGTASGIYGSCTDSCITQPNGAVWIHECYCDNAGPWSGSIAIACPTGSSCQDGACIKETLPPFDCDVSDTLEVGESKIYNIDGNEYEVTNMIVSYKDGVKVTKFIINDEVTSSLSAGKTYTLRDGLRLYINGIFVRNDEEGYNLAEFCLNGERVVPVKCTDSDGGRNIYVKGTVKHYDIEGRPVQTVESCLDTNYLYENQCNSDGSVNTEKVYCNNGCKDGICLREEAKKAYCMAVTSGHQLNVASDRSYAQITKEECYDYTSGSRLENVKKYVCLNEKGYETVKIQWNKNTLHTFSVTCPSKDNDDLKYYPDMFIEGDKFNGVLVVGDHAPAEHVIAVSDISMGLQFNAGVPGIFTRLASEIAGHELDQNIISVGGACENAVSKKLLGNPYTCNKGLKEGQGKITLQNFNGYAQIIVDGYDVKDVRAAANVLVDYDSHPLQGKEVCVDTASGKIVPCGTTVSCKDSDGKDIYTKGTAYGILEPLGTINKGKIGYASDFCLRMKDGKFPWQYDSDGWNWDNVISSENSIYSCEGNCGVYEIHCSANNEQVTGSAYRCPNGCVDGACVRESEVDMDTCLDDPNNYWDQETDSCYPGFSDEIIKNTCSDPDGGKNIYEVAHTFGFRSYSSAEDPSRDLRIRTGGKDGCASDGRVNEHYCDENGYIQSTYIECPNGCDDGECKQESKECSIDSDCPQLECMPCVSSDEDCYCPQVRCISNQCETCGKVCKNEGTKSEGWYDTCTGELIKYDDCGKDCSEYEKESERDNCYVNLALNDKDKSACENILNTYLKKSCFALFSEVPTCTDGIWNDGETGVDCGGPCKPCEIEVKCDNGCIKDGKCLPFGTRIIDDSESFFCNVDGQFALQLKDSTECQNNFECESNVCVSGNCVSHGLIDKFFSWLARLFGG